MAEPGKRELELIADAPERFTTTELGPLPEDWEVVRLGEVAEYMKAGGTPSRKEPRYWGGDIRFVVIEDMTSCGLYLRSTKETISREGLDNSSAWLVPPGSLLLSMYATIGETAINTFPVATNQAILAIIPKPIFSAEFGAYLLKYHAKRLIQQNVQSTQRNIGKGIVGQYWIPLPPLPEQRVIAHVLWAVERAKGATERVIRATRELRKSLVRHLFKYGPVTVGEAERVLLEETEIGLLPEKWKVTRFDQAFRHSQIRVKKVKQSQYKRFGRFPIVDQGQKYIAGRWDNPEDVYAGELPVIIFGDHTRIFKYVDFPFVVGADGTKILLPDAERYDPHFLYNAAMTIDIPNRGYNRHFPLLKERFLPLPPLPEQRAIARILGVVDRKLQAEEARKQAFELLFKTLLHNLMTGKVRVKALARPETGEVI